MVADMFVNNFQTFFRRVLMGFYDLIRVCKGECWPPNVLLSLTYFFILFCAFSVLIRSYFLLRSTTLPPPTFRFFKSSSFFFLRFRFHALCECHLGPEKSRFSGPTPSNGPSSGFARITIFTSRAI
jgi:hypothetical protein